MIRRRRLLATTLLAAAGVPVRAAAQPSRRAGTTIGFSDPRHRSLCGATLRPALAEG